MSNTRETILEVSGMTCGSCVRHVEAALRGIAGVCAIEVKLKDGVVRVAHDATVTTTEQMVEALGEAGYESRAASG